jgi:hypothetical protein
MWSSVLDVIEAICPENRTSFEKYKFIQFRVEQIKNYMMAQLNDIVQTSEYFFIALNDSADVTQLNFCYLYDV